MCSVEVLIDNLRYLVLPFGSLLFLIPILNQDFLLQADIYLFSIYSDPYVNVGQIVFGTSFVNPEKDGKCVCSSHSCVFLNVKQSNRQKSNQLYRVCFTANRQHVDDLNNMLTICDHFISNNIK